MKAKQLSIPFPTISVWVMKRGDLRCKIIDPENGQGVCLEGPFGTRMYGLSAEEWMQYAAARGYVYDYYTQI